MCWPIVSNPNRNNDTWWNITVHYHTPTSTYCNLTIAHDLCLRPQRINDNLYSNEFVIWLFHELFKIASQRIQRSREDMKYPPSIRQSSHIHQINNITANLLGIFNRRFAFAAYPYRYFESHWRKSRQVIGAIVANGLAAFPAVMLLIPNETYPHGKQSPLPDDLRPFGLPTSSSNSRKTGYCKFRSYCRKTNSATACARQTSPRISPIRPGTLIWSCYSLYQSFCWTTSQWKLHP